MGPISTGPREFSGMGPEIHTGWSSDAVCKMVGTWVEGAWVGRVWVEGAWVGRVWVEGAWVGGAWVEGVWVGGGLGGGGLGGGGLGGGGLGGEGLRGLSLSPEARPRFVGRALPGRRGGEGSGVEKLSPLGPSWRPSIWSL